MAESRRAANKTKCREKILKASRRLFKSKGYDDTMIEDVAEKAEVSKATLYNYFPNKESLLAGTAEDEIQILGQYLNTELADVAASEEKIRKVLIFLIYDSIPFIGISRRILYLNTCDASPLHKKGKPIRQLFGQLIEAAQREGTFKADLPAADILDLLMGIYLNSQFQWDEIETYTRQTCEEKVNHLLDLALAGVYQ